MWFKLAERRKMQLKMDRFTERHLNSSLATDSADLATYEALSADHTAQRVRRLDLGLYSHPKERTQQNMKEQHRPIVKSILRSRFPLWHV